MDAGYALACYHAICRGGGSLPLNPSLQGPVHAHGADLSLSAVEEETLHLLKL